MFAKTLRIYILVKSGLRKRKVTATQVVSFTMMAYVFLVLYLLLYTFLDTEHVRISESVSITGRITVMSSCNNNAIGFDIALSTLEGIILLATLVLCYSTRDVPDAINEAYNIAPGDLIDVTHFFLRKWSINHCLQLFIQVIISSAQSLTDKTI